MSLWLLSPLTTPATQPLLLENVAGRLQINPEAQTFQAQTLVQVKNRSQKPLTSVNLLLPEQRQMLSLSAGGQTRNYAHRGSSLQVQMPLRNGQSTVLQLRYQGKMPSLQPYANPLYRFTQYQLIYRWEPANSRLQAQVQLQIEGLPTEPNASTLPPLTAQPVLTLALNPDMGVEQVVLNGAQSRYWHTAGILHVALPRPLRAKDKYSLSLRYGGKMPTAHPLLIWDQFDSSHIRYFYPSQPRLGAY